MLKRRDILMGAATIAPLTLLLNPVTAKAKALAESARAKFHDFPKLFKGVVVRPGDTGYADARKIWNARNDAQTPALIARVTSADDVAVAVKYAAGKNIPIAVRSGGHGIEGFSMPDDAFVIDTTMMNRVSIDPATGRTTVEAGAKLGQVAAVTEPQGWVLPAGTVSTVGVAGLTLGGGIGHLTRRFGATVDHLVSVDLVTADGRKVTASAEENADLFWGLRGAGHNFGVATSFTFQPRRLQGVVTHNWLFRPEDALAVLLALNDIMAKATRNLVLTPIIQKAPPIPGVPADIVGKATVLLAIVFSGPPAEFDAAMAEAKSLPKPVMAFPGPTTWASLATVLDQWMPAGRRWYNGGGYMTAITEDFARAALDAVNMGAEGSEVHVPVMGGALHDTAEDAMAFSRRGANWMYEITTQWDAAAEDASRVEWVETLGKRLAPHTLSNGCINLNPYRGPSSLPPIFGSQEKWKRLVALKRKWDPQNRLRHNKNILPSA